MSRWGIEEEGRYEGPERRDEHGSSFLSGIPIWAKVASIVGIPGLIAFYLIWLGGQTLPNILTKVVASEERDQRLQVIVQEHIQQQAEINRLLQRICSRVSKTDAERQQCFDR